MSTICRRCVMDTSDPDIRFDSNGVCHHCHAYDRNIATRTRQGAEAAAHLQRMADQMRAEGKRRDYDCVIGVSGGVDSTYVAYAVKQLGLRPLAVHLDNGWNSELAVKNIERVLNKLGIELFTHVLDWDEFRDLQLSFLKASTPDAEIPSDHAIISLLMQMARANGVRYIMSGVNVRTESHLPSAWSTGHLDWKYIKSIHRRFGTEKLTTYPHQNLFNLVRNYWSLKWVDILNDLNYSKKEALSVLQDKLGWVYYGGKHYESIYTRFYQGYYLPQKFGFDKRRCHFSSLICGGEMSRETALEELEKPTYPEDLQREDRAYVTKKLRLTDAEFEAILNAPTKRFEDYPSYTRGALFQGLRAVYRRLRPAVRPEPAAPASTRTVTVPEKTRKAA